MTPGAEHSYPLLQSPIAVHLCFLGGTMGPIGPMGHGARWADWPGTLARVHGPGPGLEDEHLSATKPRVAQDSLSRLRRDSEESPRAVPGARPARGGEPGLPRYARAFGSCVRRSRRPGAAEGPRSRPRERLGVSDLVSERCDQDLTLEPDLSGVAPDLHILTVETSGHGQTLSCMSNLKGECTQGHPWRSVARSGNS